MSINYYLMLLMLRFYYYLAIVTISFSLTSSLLHFSYLNYCIYAFFEPMVNQKQLLYMHKVDVRITYILPSSDPPYGITPGILLLYHTGSDQWPKPHHNGEIMLKHYPKIRQPLQQIDLLNSCTRLHFPNSIIDVNPRL